MKIIIKYENFREPETNRTLCKTKNGFVSVLLIILNQVGGIYDNHSI